MHLTIPSINVWENQRRMGTAQKTTEEYLDILRLSDSRIRRILMEMDADGYSLDLDAIRYPCRPRQRIRIEMYYPSSHIGRYRVVPRAVSPHGMSVLHGSFAYRGTRCLVLLDRIDGEPVELAGEVTECRHVSGKVHELLLSFMGAIDPPSLMD